MVEQQAGEQQADAPAVVARERVPVEFLVDRAHDAHGVVLPGVALLG